MEVTNRRQVLLAELLKRSLKNPLNSSASEKRIIMGTKQSLHLINLGKAPGSNMHCQIPGKAFT